MLDTDDQLVLLFAGTDLRCSNDNSEPAMSTFFHFITPGELLDHLHIRKTLDAERVGTADAIFDAVSLARSAAEFFRGLFPLETPHFPWGELIELPWYQDYWVLCEDGQTSRPNSSILDEVDGIARELLNVEGELEDDCPWQQLTYQSATLTKSDKSIVQGLATETLLSVEGFLGHLSAGLICESFPWFAAAYKNIIECTCNAHKILSDEPEAARKAADAAMKRIAK